MRAGSLFTGTGALDMAAAEVFDTELMWLSEYEPPTKKNRKPSQAAARLLAHHFPNVPNLGDITVIDWDLVAKLSPIDVLALGWPCQPFSLAGLQLGADDDRALWPYVDGCLRALRPRYVLLENVPAVIGAELGRVADTLASLRYRFAWVCFPASAVGAPHRRERFFLLAVADTEDERHERAGGARRRRTGSPDRCGAAADTDDIERERQPVQQHWEAAPAGDCGRPDWAGYATAIHRWEDELGRLAPAPTTVGARGGEVLNPALVEWMMGLPDGWITAVPGLTRTQQIKAGGNGVVPQQAITAYRYLLDLLGLDVRVAA